MNRRIMRILTETIMACAALIAIIVGTERWTSAMWPMAIVSGLVVIMLGAVIIEDIIEVNRICNKNDKVFYKIIEDPTGEEED